MKTYLLEKSRITSQLEGEQNFHVLYTVCKGLDDETKKEWGLRRAAHPARIQACPCLAIRGIAAQPRFFCLAGLWKSASISTSRCGMTCLTASIRSCQHVACRLAVGRVEGYEPGQLHLERPPTRPDAPAHFPRPRT